MKKTISLLLLSTLLLASCGAARDSRLNPFNWFGVSRSTPADAQSAESKVNPLIPESRASIFREEKDPSYRGEDVAQVTGLYIERRPGGALIRVEGYAARQGAFDVRLIPLDAETDAGTLSYALQALQPPNTPVGAESTRRVAAVEWLTDNQLRDVRTIRVKGANNVQTTRR